MMIGTIRINVIVASLACLFTFALSISNNLFLSSLIKSGYSFLMLFVVTFGFRWVLGLLIGNVPSLENASPANDSSSVGNNLDLITSPDEDEETRELMKSNLGNNNASLSNDFSPLKPPKLVTKNNLDAEQLAGALRRMSED